MADFQANDETTFYSLRSRAYGATHVDSAEIAECFEPSATSSAKSTMLMFSSRQEDLAYTLRMAWLLGDHINFVTPHFAYSYRHKEVTGSRSYPELFSIDAEFLNWSAEVRERAPGGRVSPVPTALVRLEKTSDEIERWSHVDFRLLRSSVDNPAMLLLSEDHQLAHHNIEIDVPQLVLRNISLSEKVRQDYPVAAEEFRNLVNDSVALAVAADPAVPRATILARIREEILVPGVERLKHERRRLLKSRALTAAIEAAGISIPLVLSFAPNVDVLATKLLAAGLGLTAARELNRLRDDLASLRKTSFYAALRLRLGN